MYTLEKINLISVYNYKKMTSISLISGRGPEGPNVMLTSQNFRVFDPRLRLIVFFRLQTLFQLQQIACCAIRFFSI
jgi:hypothetical protein